jgi:hypothetical protein
MALLTNFVKFDPKYRYLIVCDALLASVAEVCEEIKDCGLTVLAIGASSCSRERMDMLSKFKQGSILVGNSGFILAGFYFDNIPGVDDIVVVNFKASPDLLKQARHRFRPTAATMIAITHSSHIDSVLPTIGVRP